MKLIKYIQEHHNGNISAFAKSQGVVYGQAARWLKRDCVVIDGGVYCRITKQVKANEANISTTRK